METPLSNMLIHDLQILSLLNQIHDRDKEIIKFKKILNKDKNKSGVCDENEKNNACRRDEIS
jgi:hypothetical protein